MKKKIIIAAMALVMGATLVAGASLAYFNDTDKATNTFTVGNVDIAVDEIFEQGAKLLPGTNEINNVQKEVYVKNTGSEEAYVRVHLGIPQLLDDGADSFDASSNLLHFNYQPESIENNRWSWAPASGSGWNYYETTIDGIVYNVYVVTYRTALSPEAKTEYPAMHQVYLDKTVSSEDISKLISEGLVDEDGQFKFLVFAEGIQADGFTSAYEAFAAGFPAITNDYQNFVDAFAE